MRALRDAVRKQVPMLAEDRRQDLDIERVLTLYREGAMSETLASACEGRRARSRHEPARSGCGSDERD